MLDDTFFRQKLTDYLTGNLTYVDNWLAAAVVDWHTAVPARQSFYILQAKRLFALCLEGLRDYNQDTPPLSSERETALRHNFPLIYSEEMLQVFATLMADYLRKRYQTPEITNARILTALEQGFAASTITPLVNVSLVERLKCLNRLSLKLCELRDQDSIIDYTLAEAPRLVKAESCLLWPWDADQQAPTMMVAPQMRTLSFPFSAALLTLFRRACADGCTLTINYGEYPPLWPPELLPFPAVFVPLLTPQGCLGILAVHHYPDEQFTQEDILLLSSLGNLVATALVNAQLYATDRHPVNLLQTSIRQVVKATSNRLDQYEEFLQSLLQVGEGLTRAEAVYAFVELEERQMPLAEMSGTLTNSLQAELQALAPELLRQQQKHGLPVSEMLGDIAALRGKIDKRLYSYYFASELIPFDGKASGIVYALNSTPFTDEQLTFLRTIAEQVGVGINNMQQSANVARLLIEMSNVSYVAETIASTFDAQKILSIINQAASQALNLPIIFCGWLEEDGSLRIIPDTAVGLTRTVEKRIKLTYNHSVIRQVLKTRKPLSSRSLSVQVRHPFPALADFGVKDWACLPMTVKSDVRGIMLAADLQPRELSTREVALLFTYANQAALAMNNSLLYEQVVERQSQRMESLINFTRTVSTTQDERVVQHELLRIATTELPAPAAILSRCKPSSEVQQVVDSLGIDSAQLLNEEFASGEGIIGSSAQRKMPVISLNLPGDGRCVVLRELARQEGFSSSLTVPLIEHDHVLGTLTVFSREAHEFTATQQYLLQSLAIAAAMAMRAITLVDPEVVSQHLTRDMAQHSVTTLSFTADLFDIAQRTEPGTLGMTRMKQRLEVMASVQGELVGTHPTLADVKGAMQRMREFWLTLAGDAHPTIRIDGTRVLLPDRQALALAILIHEWVAGVVERMQPRAEQSVVLTFQQSYHDIWVRCEIDGRWPSAASWCNPAIVEFTDFILNGSLEESPEHEKCLFRYHFVVPGD